MNFELKSLNLAQAQAVRSDALVVVVPEGWRPGSDPLSVCAAQAQAAGDFKPQVGKFLSLYRQPGVAPAHVILLGAGDGQPKALRSAIQTAHAQLRAALHPLGRVTVVLPEGSSAGSVRAVVLSLAELDYVYTATKKATELRQIANLTLAVPKAATFKLEFSQAVGVAAGVQTAREWANRPPNHATPALLARAAQALTRQQPRMRCEVLGPAEVAKLKMGAFMAVAQGSEQALRFIVLRYQGAPKSQAPTVLVGKGITFDTGGISIKPAPEMDEMKFDMSGAASVLGVFRALGELQPALNVVGLIPACENMPDGRAVKPGDVVTSMSGQTIEILNTDAEGRLILCDALTYAERFKPRAVVDIATLTGACVIALGHVRSGLFSPDDALAERLLRAGESAHDPCWRLPLDDAYAEALKTNFADVANVGGRAGGSVTAAKFLQRFASAYPWAHLDIAGTAWKSGAAKGATGRPVPLLMEFLLRP